MYPNNKVNLCPKSSVPK